MALNEDSAKPVRSSSRADTFERLYQATPTRSESVPLPDLVPLRKLTRQEEQRSVEKLYVETIQKKRENMRKSLEKVLRAEEIGRHAPKLDKDGVTTVIQRLYDETIRARTDEMHKLTVDRERAVHATKIPTKKFETPEEFQSSTMRLYDTQEADKKKSDDLFLKYNAVPVVLLRPNSVLQENDDRYYKGGFGRKQ